MSHPLATDLDHVLAHTGELWEELRGRRIFLTGATGFFGCWLMESLFWANARLGLDASLVALTRDPEAFRARAPRLAGDPALALHAGDQVDFAFPEGRFDAVIHAAVEYASPLDTFDRNLQGTRRVLDFAARSGASRVLFTSSGAAYGPQPPELPRLEESYGGSPELSDPASAYGLSKRASEHLGHLWAQSHGFEFKVARCFAFLGPYLPLDRNAAACSFMADALAGRPIQIGGDGTPLRSYLYAADLAAWLWTILMKGQPSRVYNVGGEEAVSIQSLATRVATVLAPGSDIHVAKQPAPGALPSRYLPSVARARQELGLEAWVSLDEAIRRTGRWAALPNQDRIGR